MPFAVIAKESSAKAADGIEKKIPEKEQPMHFESKYTVRILGPGSASL
jgi:hypothetical protein